MTLEVRQLVLKSSVSDEAEDAVDNPGGTAGGCGSAGADCGEDREQLKEEILTECRRWLLEQLRQQKER